jgi:hypothetical protein
MGATDHSTWPGMRNGTCRMYLGRRIVTFDVSPDSIQKEIHRRWYDYPPTIGDSPGENLAVRVHCKKTVHFRKGPRSLGWSHSFRCVGELFDWTGTGRGNYWFAGLRTYPCQSERRLANPANEIGDCARVRPKRCSAR